MRRLLFILPVVGAALGCAASPPPPALPASAPTPVAASAGRTWDAVVDVFAERNIPVRTMERASGFIATDALGMPSRLEQVRAQQRDPSARVADCGRDALNGDPYPMRATYTVLVRGDSARATVKVTARFTATAGGARGASGEIVECTSLGTWEARAEADIKARAERGAQGQ